MLNYNTELYMKKIEYFCCLLGLVLTGLACQDDDETTVIPKPEGITYGTVTDKGGNVYKTLTIGNQTWLAENPLPSGRSYSCRSGDLRRIIRRH